MEQNFDCKSIFDSKVACGVPFCDVSGWKFSECSSVLFSFFCFHSVREAVLV